MPSKTALTVERAMTRAGSYVGHKEKLPWLLDKAICKAAQHYQSLLESWESFQVFIRLIQCWLAGTYAASPMVPGVGAVIILLAPLI